MHDQDAITNLLQDILDELQEIRRYIGYLGNHLQSGDKVYITTYKSPTFGHAVTSAAPAPATPNVCSGYAVSHTHTEPIPATPDSHFGHAVARAAPTPATPDSHQE